MAWTDGDRVIFQDWELDLCVKEEIGIYDYAKTSDKYPYLLPADIVRTVKKQHEDPTYVPILYRSQL
jgi:hypothetical protein